MRFATACALVLSLVACGGSADGNTADFCRKADACNALSNMSVDECTAAIDHCLNNALPADAHDMKSSMAKCAEMESCKNFVACGQAITGC